MYMIYSSPETKKYIKKRRINEILPEENLYEIKDCGHFIQFEAKEEFFEILNRII